MSRPGEVPDLFGGVARLPPRPHLTRVSGYAAAPGSGPYGEFCRTCAHRVRRQLAGKTVSKCGHPHGYRSSSSASDILAFSPACSEWSAP